MEAAIICTEMDARGREEVNAMGKTVMLELPDEVYEAVKGLAEVAGKTPVRAGGIRAAL